LGWARHGAARFFQYLPKAKRREVPSCSRYVLEPVDDNVYAVGSVSADRHRHLAHER
jgi:hypothetical protein